MVDPIKLTIEDGDSIGGDAEVTQVQKHQSSTVDVSPKGPEGDTMDSTHSGEAINQVTHYIYHYEKHWDRLLEEPLHGVR